MNRKKGSTQARRGKRIVPSRAVLGAPGPDALLQRKYRALARRHLDKLLDRIFAEVTGLHFHVAWAPPAAKEWKPPTLTAACSLCSRISGLPLRPDCQTCGAKQLNHALRADGDGHGFTCRLGVRNFWLALRLRNETVGLACLQALDENQRKRFPAKKPGRTEGKVLSRRAFARAGQMLRFVVRHVQAASVAELSEAELTSAGRVVVALEKEQVRLHEALKEHLPPAPAVARREGPQTHPEELVQSLLKCIEGNYSKSVTLRHCATKLGMNAAYLSDLFSHAVGVPFKTHLTEHRIAKSKELLSDPAQNLTEVAGQVGYASENRFRIAFKKVTGLSPKAWRETMQVTPLP